MLFINHNFSLIVFAYWKLLQNERFLISHYNSVTNKLTPCGRVRFDKLLVSQSVNEEPEISLRPSKESVIGPCAKADECSSHPSLLFLV